MTDLARVRCRGFMGGFMGSESIYLEAAGYPLSDEASTPPDTSSFPRRDNDGAGVVVRNNHEQAP